MRKIKIKDIGRFSEEQFNKVIRFAVIELDARLKESKFLAGSDYTIADIATWPWMARHEWHDIGLKRFKNLTRWYENISDRDGVKKGFAFMDKNELPPKP